MRLNLKDIINVPGASLPFSYQLDLSGMELNGERPIQEPVAVEGQVQNRGGALMLEGTASSVLHLTCDRCTKAFTREKVVPLTTLLATELADEASEDEIVLLEDDEVDLDALTTTAFVLAMESKNLCSEDCKGICPGCGADLNAGPCRCKPEVDPRLAVLAKLLEDKESE